MLSLKGTYYYVNGFFKQKANALAFSSLLHDRDGHLHHMKALSLIELRLRIEHFSLDGNRNMTPISLLKVCNFCIFFMTPSTTLKYRNFILWHVLSATF